MDAVAALESGMAIVLGEPGAGKSRLLAEAGRRRQAAGTETVAVACLRAATDIPFDPLVTLTKKLCARGRLSPRAQRAVGTASDARRLQLLCEAFERAASETPLSLQLDDLHWADLHTLQAMHYCIDRLRDLPLAWIVAARPGHAASDEFGAALARAHHADTVELDGLSVDDVGALAGALVPDVMLDERTIAGLHERTGGNPLYLELLLQARDDETAPDLRRALEERVGALLPDALAVAAAIAAQGGAVTAAALAGVAGLPAARVTRALATLIGSRLLRRTGAGYAFRHGLLRDACRAPLDEGVAERIPAPPSEPSDEAAQLYARGVEFEANDDLQRARDAFERGLALCEAGHDEPLAIRLRARRAAVEGRLGNPHESLTALEDVTGQAAASGLNAAVAECCVELCALSELIGDAARYERWCRFGLAAAVSGAGHAKGLLLVDLAQVALGKGQLREALAHAGAAADEHGSAAERCRALCVQAHASAMLGDFGAATRLLEQAARIVPAARARRTVALASGVLGELRGDAKNALGAYAGAVADGGDEGHRDVLELAALAGIVRCACVLGRRDEAQAAVERLRAMSRLGWAVARRFRHEAEGYLALLDGDTARGCAELVRASELGGEPFWRSRSLLRVADARKDRKLFLGVIETFDGMDAVHAAETARTVARAHGLRPGRKRDAQGALSAREDSVATLVASGKTNSEIGELLHITSRTAEYHVGNILTKWGLRSRVEVATRVAAGRKPAED